MWTSLSWLSSSSLLAWTQAIGSILALLIAIWIPAWQRLNAQRDARAERAREERVHLSRLSAGLRAEIEAAVGAANRRKVAVEQTLRALQEARERGTVVQGIGRIQPGSMVVTDATIYRQIAVGLGRLPPEVIKSVVAFYALARTRSAGRRCIHCGDRLRNDPAACSKTNDARYLAD